MIHRDSIPIFPLVLPVLFALIFQEQLIFTKSVSTGLVIAVFALLNLFHLLSPRWKQGWFFILFRFLMSLAIVAVLLWNIHLSNHQYFDYKADNYFIVHSEFSAKPGASYSRFLAEPIGFFETPLPYYRTIIFEKKTEKCIAVGSIIHLTKTPKSIQNKENQPFDFKAYYLEQGISHQVFVNAFDWRVVQHNYLKQARLKAAVLKVQTAVKSKLKDLFVDKSVYPVLNAMILGDKKSLDAEDKAQFSSLGIVHVLAVSGMHLGLIFVLLDSVLRMLKHMQRKGLYALIHLSVAWFYALVTGFSPSVQRAAMMLSVIVIGQALNRKGKALNTLFFCFLIMVIMDPDIFKNIGFQLSFLAILGILTVAKPISTALHFESKIFQVGWRAASVSIAAHLATFPLVLYYFHIHSNLFVISNLLLVPLFVCLLYLGIFALVVSLISPLLAQILVPLIAWIYTLIDRSSEFLNVLPYSSFNEVNINPRQLIFCYVFLVFFFFSIERKSKYLLGFSALILLGIAI
jgi:competence protein ComEC